MCALSGSYIFFVVTEKIWGLSGGSSGAKAYEVFRDSPRRSHLAGARPAVRADIPRRSRSSSKVVSSSSPIPDPRRVDVSAEGGSNEGGVVERPGLLTHSRGRDLTSAWGSMRAGSSRRRRLTCRTRASTSAGSLRGYLWRSAGRAVPPSGGHSRSEIAAPSVQGDVVAPAFEGDRFVVGHVKAGGPRHRDTRPVRRIDP